MGTPRIRFSSRADELAGRFARELLAARASAGLTQRQVARLARVSQPLVSQAERGATVPGLRIMHRLAAATGHDLSLRFFPADGVRLRDTGQLRVAELIRSAAHPNWEVRLEVPVGVPPDRRAADMILERSGELVILEIERALLDLQAQLRSAQLKRGVMADRVNSHVRLVLAIPDTHRNRGAVNEHWSLISASLPVTSRQLWASLRSGTNVGGDGLLWVRSSSLKRSMGDGDKAGYWSRADRRPSDSIEKHAK